MNKHLFCGLKLRSGETIFAEVLDKNELIVKVKEPILVKQKVTDEGLEMLVFPFANYAIDNEHVIAASHIYMIDMLSREYITYYGKAIMNMKLSKIRNETYEFLVGDIEEDYFKIAGMLDIIKKESEYYVDKFDIQPPDFSDIESKLGRYKPTLQ